MSYEVVVVGGGIVGAATAWELTSRGYGPVLVLEKENNVARHQTSHNSGVIHSGIYYQPGSFKAVMCREGAAATKAFAASHGIPVRNCGKLLVATNPRELERLSALEERAKINAIDAETIDAAELCRREPHITGLGALFIRETAVTDFTAITAKLAQLVTEAGGELRTGVTVTGIEETTDAVTLTTDQGPVTARQVVFCAGLQSDRMARLSGLATDVRIVPFRGEYYDIVPQKACRTRHSPSSACT